MSAPPPLTGIRVLEFAGLAPGMFLSASPYLRLTHAGMDFSHPATH